MKITFVKCKGLCRPTLWYSNPETSNVLLLYNNDLVSWVQFKNCLKGWSIICIFGIKHRSKVQYPLILWDTIFLWHFVFHTKGLRIVLQVSDRPDIKETELLMHSSFKLSPAVHRYLISHRTDSLADGQVGGKKHRSLLFKFPNRFIFKWKGLYFRSQETFRSVHLDVPTGRLIYPLYI